jgi:MOSC domain-containing protein YiiM
MIERIFIRAVSGGPAIEQRSVIVVAGSGIDGDRYFGRHDEPGQNVTLVEAEEIERFQQQNRQPFDLSVTGRNLVTRGVRLNALVGKEFRVGEVVLRGIDLCEPCRTLGMALARDGLAPAAVVKALVHRVGLRADAVSDGIIAVGDAVEDAD